MPSEERERQLPGTFLRAWNHPPMSFLYAFSHKELLSIFPLPGPPTSLQWLQVKKVAGPNGRTFNERILRSMDNAISCDHHL